MYKWTVYLNNKCSKEQPQAWSVVRKCKNNKRAQFGGAVHLTPRISEEAKTFASLLIWLIKYQEFVTPVSHPLSDKYEDSAENLLKKKKKGWVKSISSMVRRRRLMPSWPIILFTKRQQTSCWASAVNNLKDAEDSDGGNSSDDDMRALMKSSEWTRIKMSQYRWSFGNMCERWTSQYPTLKSSAVNTMYHAAENAAAAFLRVQNLSSVGHPRSRPRKARNETKLKYEGNQLHRS